LLFTVSVRRPDWHRRAVQAIGKNLFARFGANDIVHVHFGMAGAWAVFAPGEAVPEPTATTRLRLEEVLEHGAKSGGKPRGFTAHLSAMTVAHGGLALLEAKRAELGEDPLREDAQPERLWGRVSKSSKGIGAIIMDQSFFAGPGNIYRAEILFKAAVHPDTAGRCGPQR
jgi:endonuclease-8